MLQGEDLINPESQIETFAIGKSLIDNARWPVIPFYVRSGKPLTEKRT